VSDTTVLPGPECCTHWLVVRGRGDRPLERIHGDRVAAHHSSKRPSVTEGELVVLYASVWQAIYGIAEIAGPPEQDQAKRRWSWRFPLRPLVVIDDLDRAPAVEEAGVFPSSLWRHSHIRLSPAQFARARELIERRA
jgi:hypothetical protein